MRRNPTVLTQSRISHVSFSGLTILLLPCRFHAKMVQRCMRRPVRMVFCPACLQQASRHHWQWLQLPTQRAVYCGSRASPRQLGLCAPLRWRHVLRWSWCVVLMRCPSSTAKATRPDGEALEENERFRATSVPTRTRVRAVTVEAIAA